jgi:uncharacterized protein YjbI with pentapeptide repeats
MEMNMIGNKIAEARKKINISQAELAEHLFISPQAVGKWERGESIPDIITFNRLAKILGVDLNYFSEDFQGTTVAMPAPEYSAEPAVSQQKSKLNWDMSRGNWIDADFSGLSGLNEKFSSSNLRRCKFVGSDLSGLLLKSNHVDGCDFSDSNISGSRFQSAHLVNNLFNSCSLKASEFSSCHMKACNFSGADFSGATFKSSDFQKNITSNAVLNRTSFINSQLADIIFEGTLEECYFGNCAFSKVTFQNSKLINTFFKCRSLKHLRFVDCQADRMTYEFLKNGKADLSGITLIA